MDGKTFAIRRFYLDNGRHLMRRSLLATATALLIYVVNLIEGLGAHPLRQRER